VPEVNPEEATPWHKAIPKKRDRLQSTMLVGVLLPWIIVFSLLSCLSPIGFDSGSSPAERNFAYLACFVSLTFAVGVWALRAATPLAALCGGLINFLVLLFTPGYDLTLLRSGMTPLVLLFLLTFAATKAGKQRKVKAGLAESRKGRNAAQVLANLGAASVILSPLGERFFTALYRSPLSLSLHRRYHDYPTHPWAIHAALLAALAEATADTVSSEIGQAFGGSPILLTTLSRVAPGTDGAITPLGTAAGIIAATVVVLTGQWAMRLPAAAALVALAGGIFGLFFDSMLGATIERKGWLGNDLVNFTSTLAAAAFALAILALL
jgi:uncharacterized membrane protein